MPRPPESRRRRRSTTTTRDVPLAGSPLGDNRRRTTGRAGRKPEVGASPQERRTRRKPGPAKLPGGQATQRHARHGLQAVPEGGAVALKPTKRASAAATRAPAPKKHRPDGPTAFDRGTATAHAAAASSSAAAPPPFVDLTELHLTSNVCVELNGTLERLAFERDIAGLHDVLGRLRDADATGKLQAAL